MRPGPRDGMLGTPQDRLHDLDGLGGVAEERTLEEFLLAAERVVQALAAEPHRSKQVGNGRAFEPGLGERTPGSLDHISPVELGRSGNPDASGIGLGVVHLSLEGHLSSSPVGGKWRSTPCATTSATQSLPPERNPTGRLTSRRRSIRSPSAVTDSARRSKVENRNPWCGRR